MDLYGQSFRVPIFPPDVPPIFPPFFPHPKAGTAHGLQGREADFAQASADATGMAVAMEQLRTEHRATLQGGMLVRLDGFDLGLKSMCKNRTMIA